MRLPRSPSSPRIGKKAPRNRLVWILLALLFGSLLLLFKSNEKGISEALPLLQLPARPPVVRPPTISFDEAVAKPQGIPLGASDYRPLLAAGESPVSSSSFSSNDYPLSQFLRDRLEKGDVEKPEKLWLSVADGNYTREALDHLTRMLGRLNAQQRRDSSGKSQPHTLLILCLDEECLDLCVARNWLCYGGFVDDDFPQSGPTGMSKVQWIKTSGMAELLGAGYATLFVDADVFFRRDPFERLLKPLSDPSWDIQIQDESHNGMVNIGLVFMRATDKAAALWRDIQSRLQQQGGWDQDHFNAILDTVNLRKHHEPTFVSPGGFRVIVLHAIDAWGFHFGWMFPEETALLHMTCCGTDLDDKLYIAAAYGATLDAATYIDPPKGILTISTLSGTAEELALTMRVLMAAAHASGRAFLPPLMGTVLGKPNAEDGIVRGDLETISVDSRGDAPDPESDPLTLHRRFFWSIFKPSVLMDHYPDVHLLEPNYIEHAVPALLDAGQSETVKNLSRVMELDLRPIFEWQMLINRLTSPHFEAAQVVRISTDEGALPS